MINPVKIEKAVAKTIENINSPEVFLDTKSHMPKAVKEADIYLSNSMEKLSGIYNEASQAVGEHFDIYA